MFKYSLTAVLLFSGCSYFEFNAAMCEDIGPKDDPALIEQCRDYNEKEAQKAFDNTKSKSSTQEDVIEFNKGEVK